MNRRQVLTKDATQYAWSFIGKWYKWGGDDPSGFDCSGLCIEILKSVGLFPRKGDTTANGLRERFIEQTAKRQSEGCLALWYNKDGSRIIHVEYCIDSYRTIGASGGGSKTLTENDAIRHNAFIKIRPTLKGAVYVNPFLGVV